MILVEDSVPAALSGGTQAIRDFPERRQVKAREFVELYALELDETEDRAVPVATQSLLNRTVVVCSLQVGLR